MAKYFIGILLIIPLAGFQCYKGFHSPPILHEFNLPITVSNPKSTYNIHDTLWIESSFDLIQDTRTGQLISLKDSVTFFQLNISTLVVKDKMFYCEDSKNLSLYPSVGNIQYAMASSFSDTSYDIITEPLRSSNNQSFKFGVVLKNPGYFLLRNISASGSFVVSKLTSSLSSPFFNLEKRFELSQSGQVRNPDEFTLKNKYGLGFIKVGANQFIIKVI